MGHLTVTNVILTPAVEVKRSERLALHRYTEAVSLLFCMLPRLGTAHVRFRAFLAVMRRVIRE